MTSLTVESLMELPADPVESDHQHLYAVYLECQGHQWDQLC